eukprot:Rmarinus@m.6969
MLHQFDIERTAQLVLEHGFSRVALQFPDELLPYSYDVQRELQLRTPASYFVLGDTTYGSCCVDEIAAEHVSADFVVHYGDSCLSPIRRLPVQFVLGLAELDIARCVSLVREWAAGLSSPLPDVLVVLYDLPYAHAAGLLQRELGAAMSGVGIDVAVAEAVLYRPAREGERPTARRCGEEKAEPQSKSDASGCSCFLQKPVATASMCAQSHTCASSSAEDGGCNCADQANSTGCGSRSGQRCDCMGVTSRSDGDGDNRPEEIPHGCDSDVDIVTLCGLRMRRSLLKKERKAFLLVGGEENAKWTSVMMEYSQTAEFACFDPSTDSLVKVDTSPSSRLLRKRYYLVNKAREAESVGIVVGTLGIADYLETIHFLQRRLSDSGKKYYTFVVGKINVAKLANFPDVGVFVLVACPQNSLVDSKEYYAPIVTPFELLLALQGDDSWTGEYTLSFAEAVREASLSVAARPEDSDEATTEGATPGKDVVSRPEAGALQRWGGEGGAAWLHKREFQGLEMRVGETPVEKATPGMRGTARGYVSIRFDEQATNQ